MITNFKKKQKKGNLETALFSFLGGILVIAVILILIVADFKVNQKKSKLGLEVATLEKKIADINKKNEELKQGIAQAGSDQYIEKVLREEQDMQKPGEKVVTFVMPEETVKKEAQQEQFFNYKAWAGWLTSRWQWIINKF